MSSQPNRDVAVSLFLPDDGQGNGFMLVESYGGITLYCDARSKLTTLCQVYIWWRHGMITAAAYQAALHQIREAAMPKTCDDVKPEVADYVITTIMAAPHQAYGVLWPNGANPFEENVMEVPTECFY